MGTHLRAWRPRWASVRWWAWLGSSCPRPWRPSSKRRHLGGGDGSHSLAQSFIPRAVATELSAQGRSLESQNGTGCRAHAARRGDGCHRREWSSLGCTDLSPPVHPIAGLQDHSAVAPEVEADRSSLPAPIFFTEPEVKQNRRRRRDKREPQNVHSVCTALWWVGG